MFRLSSLFQHRSSRINLFSSIRSLHSVYPLTIREVFDRKPLDQTINLSGYLLNIRKLKTHYFLDLFDGSLVNNSKHLQVIASLEKHPNLPRLTHGCSVNVQGKLVRSTHPKQEYEFLADNISLINACDTVHYPLKPKVNLELVDLRRDEHLRLRSPLIQAIFRLRSQMMFSFYEYFSKENYVQIPTPCITQNDCEGGGETFRIQPYVSRTTEKEKDYFNRQAYLTVSGQLHLEAAAK